MKMLQVKRLRVRLAIAAVAMTCVLLLHAGCSDTPEPSTSPPAQGGTEVGPYNSGGVYFDGTVTLEERILRAEAIARVRFRSVKQVVEYLQKEPGFYVYVGALEFTFEILEYLKGSGGAEVKAVVYDGDELYLTRAEAEASDEDFLAARETRWDNREAIVFLREDSDYIASTSQADRYWMTYLRANGQDGYTVASKYTQAWLPDAAAPTGAAGASGGEQKFLLKAPAVAGSASGASGQGQTGQSNTITISALKALIGRLQAEVDAAGGTADAHRCVVEKYYWPRRLQHQKEWFEADGRQFSIQFDRQIASGLPAGTEAHVGGDYIELSEVNRLNKPANGDDLVVKTGRDADLFAKGWPLTAVTARPLPVGTYRFYWAEQSSIDALCDAMPELHRTRREVVVTVTAPEGTVHETMFNPVTLTAGVGVDGTNGVISASDLTVGSASTSISGLKWENNQVVLSLSSFNSLEGYRLDFIELDGSIGLSLPASSAVEDSAAKTLTWDVRSQPWHDGDLLMLRITPALGVTVSADHPNPTADQPVVFSASISNGPAGQTPSYRWDLDLGAENWYEGLWSNAAFKYLGNSGETAGVRVTVDYGSGLSVTSDPFPISWP